MTNLLFLVLTFKLTSSIPDFIIQVRLYIDLRETIGYSKPTEMNNLQERDNITASFMT